MSLERFLDYYPSARQMLGGGYEGEHPLQTAQRGYKLRTHLVEGGRWNPTDYAPDREFRPFNYQKVLSALGPNYNTETEVNATLADRLTKPLPFQATPLMGLAEELDGSLLAKIASAVLCVFESIYQTGFRYLVAPAVLFLTDRFSPNTAELLRVRLASAPSAVDLLMHRTLQIVDDW